MSSNWLALLNYDALLDAGVQIFGGDKPMAERAWQRGAWRNTPIGALKAVKVVKDDPQLGPRTEPILPNGEPDVLAASPGDFPAAGR